jgi:hypothetical protein
MDDTRTIEKPGIPESVRQWFAGFFDGDGSCGLTQKSIVFLTLCQSCDNGIPPSLLLIQRYYGGSIIQKRPHDKWRTMHALCWYSVRDIESVLFDIEKYSIVKRTKAKLLLEFISSNKGHPDPTTIAYFKSHVKNYKDVIVDKEKITLPYLSGVVDADGHVALDENGSCRLEITKNSCPPLIYAIKEKYSINLATKSLVIHGKKALDIISDIDPFSVQKKDQITALLDYSKWKTDYIERNKKRKISDEWTEKKIEVRKKLMKLKRQ